MDQYKVAIIDDDEISLDALCFKLQKYNALELIGTARNGVAGKKLINKVRPDLLFLDVELPDMKGMDLLEQIQDNIDWNMRVVFYTAYDKYMLPAIRRSAFDYLLKPFSEDELDVVISRFIKIASHDNNCVTIPPIALSATHADQTFIIITPTNDMRVLRPMEIGYFCYRSEYKQWEAVLADNSLLALKKSTIAEQIINYSSCFIQVHQAFIININYLMMIKDGRCILYPPFDGAVELVVSRKYKRVLADRFCL